MTRLVRGSLFCVLAMDVLGSGTAARAGSVSVSSVTPTATFGAASYGSAFDETANLPQFNPALGVLQSVSLTLEAVGTTPGWSFDVYNPFTFDVGGIGVISGSLRALRPDSSLLVLVVHSSPFTDLGSLPSKSTTTVDISVADNAKTVVLNDPADLALFTGMGSLALSVKGFGSPNVSPDTLDILAATPQEGFARLTATYSFVPEPSSLSMLLTSAIGAVAMAYRAHRLRQSHTTPEL